MRISALLPFLIFSILAINEGHAAESASQALYRSGMEAMQASDYPRAIKSFQEYIAQYPSESIINTVQFNLALSELSSGNPDDAFSIFNKLATSQTSKDLREEAVFYSGQTAFYIASAAPIDSPKRNQSLKQAVTFYGQCLTDYPKGPFVEQALYSRAQANFHLGEYDSMQQDLAQLIAGFPESGSLTDYLFWSGRGYATQANNLLKTDLAKARTVGKQALDAFAKIRDLPGSVLSANESRLDAANVELNLASTDADYELVLTNLRKVLSRDMLIPLVNKVVAEMTARMPAAAVSPDKTQIVVLMQRRQDQLTHLAELKAGVDPALDAWIRMLAAYSHLKKSDEMRTIANYIKPFLSTDEQKQSVSFFTIISYALQGLTKEADAALLQHEATFAKDANAQNLRILIGDELRSKGDPAGAEDQYRKYLQDSPNGRIVEQATVDLAEVLLDQRKETEAETLLSDFLKKKPGSPLATESHYDLGLAYAAQKKTNEAVTQFHLALADSKSGSWQINSGLQAGYALFQASRPDEAIKELQQLVTTFPSAEQAASALYYEGMAFESKNDSDSALLQYSQILKDFASHPIAPSAAGRMVRIHLTKGKTDEMQAIAHQMMTNYPEDPQSAIAAANAGQFFEKQRSYQQAAEYYKFAAKQSGSAVAPVAQSHLAVMWMTAGRSLGAFQALNEEEKKEWQQDIYAGEQATLEGLHLFPTSPDIAPAVEELIKITVKKIDLGILTSEQGLTYFPNLAAKEENPLLKGRLELAGISVLDQRGPHVDVLPLFEKVNAEYSGLKYDPEALELYGARLMDAKKYPQATETFKKLQTDFPKNPQAQAEALYGLGAIQLSQGQTAAADEFFTLLEQGYGWSDKISKARLGRGQAAEDRGDTVKARGHYQQVILATSSTTEMKAQALFNFARTLEKDGKLVADPANPKEPNAANNYLKVDALYDSVKDVAAEGLWRAGQIFEKAGLPAKARRAYLDLTTKYQKSTFYPQAQSRLAALPAQ